ncbi:MAG: hypothetical protein ACRED0_07290 [Gammaproteobacteria bacterium]
MKEVVNKALYLGLLAASFTMAEEPEVELEAVREKHWWWRTAGVAIAWTTFP